MSPLSQMIAGSEPRTGADLVSLRDTAARVVRARHGGDDPEDLVQEAWSRVALALRNRPIDDPHGYTAGIAANLVRGRFRQDRRWQRRAPLLFTRPTTDAPDGQVVRREEGDALVTALHRLPHEARALLVAHVVDGIDTATLAERAGTSPGAVAAGLARARAMLRVEYLIAFRHLPEPPERCRRVCFAVSANDTRRERRLDATGHLSTCDVCRDLADTLRERRRPAMLGALALRMSGWAGRAADWQQAARRSGLGGAGLGGAGLGGAGVVGVVGVGVVSAGVVGAIALGSMLSPALPPAASGHPAAGVTVLVGRPAAVGGPTQPTSFAPADRAGGRGRWLPASAGRAAPSTPVVAPLVTPSGAPAPPVRIAVSVTTGHPASVVVPAVTSTPAAPAAPVVAVGPVLGVGPDPAPIPSSPALAAPGGGTAGPPQVTAATVPPLPVVGPDGPLPGV